MNITIVERKMQISEELRAYAIKKVTKLICIFLSTMVIFITSTPYTNFLYSIVARIAYGTSR